MLREFMDITRALSDENRVRTLMFLREGELCVCQIIEMLGLAPSTVSKHLSILKQARLVETQKKGRWIYYRLPQREVSPAVAEALAWMERSLEKDKRILADQKQLRKVLKTSLEDLCSAYFNSVKTAA